MSLRVEVRGTGEWIEIRRAPKNAKLTREEWEAIEPQRFERQEMVLRRDGEIVNRWKLVNRL